MADDDPVRDIATAPSAQARAQAHARDAEDHAQRIATELRRTGAVVLACADDAERDQARHAGRRAGDIIGRSVRTKILPDQSVGIWDAERQDNPLQARLDERRATRTMDQAFARLGPLTGHHTPDVGP
ncbi:hypothetical protein F4561_005651 [Lipingzhangella halophila]|uniref:Uncharacterized protein n=1 Tax=Lipingzhangella halophila TaxID=1783352 RepID=A0A7W7RML2_9ACTN|nr:hypothetical protein [Lipingzhangella halophila]MBB4934757.1 hypothetical protein [Lipingzhangella halophila]